MPSRFTVPKPPRPEEFRKHLEYVRSTCNLCTKTLHGIPQTNLPPGTYHRKRVEIALKRSIEHNVYLLELVEHLMNKRHLEFWSAVQESAKPIQDGPDWLKAGISLNPDVYETYDQEKPIPLTRKKIDENT